MEDIDFLKAIHNYMENLTPGGIRDILKTDSYYQESLAEERRLYELYELMELSEMQRNMIENLIEAIYAQSADYSLALYKLGMQNCYHLLKQLTES